MRCGLLSKFFDHLLSKPAVGRFGIERHPYTKSRIDQFPCVYVYVCNYSSQTTEPICIKLYQQIERLTLIAIGYLDLKYLPHHI